MSEDQRKNPFHWSKFSIAAALGGGNIILGGGLIGLADFIKESNPEQYKDLVGVIAKLEGIEKNLG